MQMVQFTERKSVILKQTKVNWISWDFIPLAK